MATPSHAEAQRRGADACYTETRSHVTSADPATRYIVDWRLKTSLEHLRRHAGPRLQANSSILFLCAGEGPEASTCCNLGYANVSFSDLSPVAVESGMQRDPRLKGFTADAENTGLAAGSYDVVVVQDGLHHLQRPVDGFTEMLRVARVGVVFIEPHDAFVGGRLGTKWERNGEAINFVFRWSKGLVEAVASSYLGPDSFDNLSFSYWHHNVVYARIADLVVSRHAAVVTLRAIKAVLDVTLGSSGNMFSGIVLKTR